jgi:hypothetical protein
MDDSRISCSKLVYDVMVFSHCLLADMKESLVKTHLSLKVCTLKCINGAPGWMSGVVTGKVDGRCSFNLCYSLPSWVCIVAYISDENCVGAAKSGFIA